VSSPRPGFSPPRAGGGASHARGLAASVGQASADLFLPSRRSRGQDRAFHLPTRSAPRRWASLRMRRHQQPAAMKTVSPRGPPRSFGIVGSVGSVRSPVSPDGGSDAPLPGPSSRPPVRPTSDHRGLAETTLSTQGQPRGQPPRGTWSLAVLGLSAARLFRFHGSRRPLDRRAPPGRRVQTVRRPPPAQRLRTFTFAASSPLTNTPPGQSPSPPTTARIPSAPSRLHHP